MTVKALIPVRTVNLVAPLAHKATDMHTTETAAPVQVRSGAASRLIAVHHSTSLRAGGLHSAMVTLPTPGIATQDMPAADLHQSANSYFGLLRQASHSHHDRTRIASLLLQRGHVVKADFTKTYRRSTTC